MIEMREKKRTTECESMYKRKGQQDIEKRREREGEKEVLWLLPWALSLSPV